MIELNVVGAHKDRVEVATPKARVATSDNYADCIKDSLGHLYPSPAPCYPAANGKSDYINRQIEKFEKTAREIEWSILD